MPILVKDISSNYLDISILHILVEVVVRAISMQSASACRLFHPSLTLR